MPIIEEAGLGWGRRLLPPIAAAAVTAAALVFLGDQFERGAERRALTQRYAELTVQALAPGSTLACLDGALGETVENACEKTVFASPQNTASAVAYTAARLTLLADAAAFSRRKDPDFRETFAPLRRAIELDRFGIAAHVLAVHDSCTADRCAAFALLNDVNVIKSNLKAQVFDQYVSRYAGSWEKTEPVAKKPPPAPPPAPVVSLANPPANKPVSSKYSFPSAASIPAVSIMNSEPPRAKEGTDALAAQPTPPAGERDRVPVPPKRPQPQTAPPQVQ